MVKALALTDALVVTVYTHTALLSLGAAAATEDGVTCRSDVQPYPFPLCDRTVVS